MQYAQNTENRGKQCLCGLQGISALQGAWGLLVAICLVSRRVCRSVDISMLI